MKTSLHAASGVYRYVLRIQSCDFQECLVHVKRNDPIKVQWAVQCDIPLPDVSCAIWFLVCRNIQPIRIILLRRAGRSSEHGLVSSLFPYLPWKTQPSGRVAIDSGAITFRQLPSVSTLNSDGTVMDMLIGVPPLLEAFKVFCQKALCSEVTGPWKSRLVLASLKALLEASPHSKFLMRCKDDFSNSFQRLWPRSEVDEFENRLRLHRP